MENTNISAETDRRTMSEAVQTNDYRQSVTGSSGQSNESRNNTSGESRSDTSGENKSDTSGENMDDMVNGSPSDTSVENRSDTSGENRGDTSDENRGDMVNGSPSDTSGENRSDTSCENRGDTSDENRGDMVDGSRSGNSGENRGDTSGVNRDDMVDGSPSDTSRQNRSDTSCENRVDTSSENRGDMVDGSRSGNSGESRSDTSGENRSNTSDANRGDMVGGWRSGNSSESRSGTSGENRSDTSGENWNDAPKSDTVDGSDTADESKSDNSEGRRSKADSENTPPTKPILEIMAGHTRQKTEESQTYCEDKDILKANGILCRLSRETFQTLVPQMQSLRINTESKLQALVHLIYEKAISCEPSRSVVFANLCRCLSMYKVPSESTPRRTCNFRALLLTRCHRDFQSATKAKVKQATAGESETTDADAAGQVKQRQLGNIRFIGELFKLKMLTENIIHDCIFKLLKDKDPHNIEAVCCLLTTVGKQLETEKAKARIDQYFTQLTKIAGNKSTPPRISPMIQEVIAIRRNNWASRSSTDLRGSD